MTNSLFKLINDYVHSKKFAENKTENVHVSQDFYWVASQ